MHEDVWVNWREHLASTVGHDLKRFSQPQELRKIHQDSSRIDQDEEYEAKICCANWGRRSNPATSYGDDAGLSRSDGSVKS